MTMLNLFLIISVFLMLSHQLSAKDGLSTLSQVFANNLGLTEEPSIEFIFKQSWQKSEQEGFRPGHVALYPSANGLAIIATLNDEDIYSASTAMNQPMWQLGDVFELFVAVPGQSKYWELHITPHNHRLQLGWTEQTFNSFRQKNSALSDHVITDVGFFTSAIRIEHNKEYWQVYAFLPWKSIGLSDGRDVYSLELAFCRYDSNRSGRTPILSSTALFDRKNFHMRERWNNVVLNAGNDLACKTGQNLSDP